MVLGLPGSYVSMTSNEGVVLTSGGPLCCRRLARHDVNERERAVHRPPGAPAGAGDRVVHGHRPGSAAGRAGRRVPGVADDCERSPNTVEAYAHDLRAFWTFLGERGLSWDRVGVMELGEFAAWARRPAENVVVLADESARLSARTVNRMLSGVVGVL